MVYRIIGPSWLTRWDVCNIFGIDPKTLGRWRSAGLLNGTEIHPRVYRYRRVDVEALANTPGKPAQLARSRILPRRRIPADPLPAGTGTAAAHVEEIDVRLSRRYTSAAEQPPSCAPA